MTFPSSELDFCVLIPCYNNIRGLIQSVNSIHYYEGRYLIIIVDDGSEVPVTTEALASKLKEHKPVQLIRNKKNKGITDALNTGLKWITENTATGYIARLDCSDICTERRFYEQVNYLNNHSEVGLIGSWCYFKEEGTSLHYPYTTPTDYKKIKKSMYSRNVFIHPTVMFRKELLNRVGCYPYEYPYAEDYALFWKMMNVTKAVILDQFLVTCAINRNGISITHRKEQLISRKKVVAHFGSSYMLKMAGYIKVTGLWLLPSTLILNLKNIK